MQMRFNTDDVIHSTQYKIKYTNRAILVNLQQRSLKLGRLVVIYTGNTPSAVKKLVVMANDSFPVL